MKWLLRRFLATHIGLYRLTGGRVGGKLGNNAILLLYTVGRKSGRQQITPLVYFRDGNSYVITASNGGAARHPAWYYNLKARPQTQIQVMGRQIQVTVEEAAAPVHERLWQQLIAGHPQFAGYQAKTARVIPLLVLHPR